MSKNNSNGPVISWSDLISPDDSLLNLLVALEDVEKEYNKITTGIVQNSAKMKRSIDELLSSAGNNITSSAGFIRQANEIKGTIKDLSVMMKTIAEAKKAISQATISQEQINLAGVKAEMAPLRTEAERMKLEMTALKNESMQLKLAFEPLKSESIQLKTAMTAMRNEAMRSKIELMEQSKNAQMLTQRLNENAAAFRELSEREKVSAISSGEYLDAVSSMRAGIQATNRALNSFSTELSKVNVQLDKDGKVIETYTIRTLKLSEAEKQLVVQAKAREIQSKKAMALADAEAKVAASQEGSYERLEATIERNTILIRQMGKADLELANREGGLIHQTKGLRDELRKRQQEMGDYASTMAHFSKVWNGFDFSIAQIVRELPNAGISLRTFIMSLSNNIATVGDEMAQFFNMRETELKRSLTTYEKWSFGIKRIFQALKSWNTILMVAVTLFTAFGEQMIKAVGNWFSGVNALEGLDRASVRFAENFKNVSTSLGESLYNFHKLRMEWNAMKDDADKVSWIDRNEEAFAQLGIRIRDAADATNIFTKAQEDMLAVLKDRAMFEAAQKFAKEESDKWGKAVIDNEAAKNKALAENPGVLMSNVGDPLLRMMIPGFKDYTSARGGQLIISLKEEDQKAITDALYQKAKDFGYNNGQDIFKIQEFARQNNKFAVVFNDYMETIQKDVEIAKEEAVNMKAAIELEAKMAKKVRENRIKIAEEYFEVENLFGTYVYKNGSSLAGKFADFKNADEMLEWYDKIVAAKGNNKMTTFSDFYGTTEYQKFLFSDLSKKKSGSERKGPEGKDFDAWYARVSETYRHKEAEAEAKADQDSWERKIELIDERYKHELIKLKELKREADNILSGKTLVKGGLTKDRRDKLNTFIGSYSGLESDVIEANKREAQDVIDQRLIKTYEHEKAIIDLKLKGVEKESDAERGLMQERLEWEKRIALLRNSLLPDSERMSEDDINAGFNLQQKQLNKSQRLSVFDKLKSTFLSGRNTEKLAKQNERKLFGFNQRQQDIYDIQTQKALLIFEKERLEIELEYTEDAENRKRLLAQILNLDQQIASLDNQENEKKGIKGLLGSISEKGLLGGVLDKMGMEDEMASATVSSYETIKGYISDLIDSYVDLAEAAVKAQEAQVTAAQKVVDAELEASKNGYANRVVSAQEELKLEKQKLKEQKKQRESALKAQRAMDTVEAASSLTVATASLWKAATNTFGVAGPVVAAVLTAGMFGSFIASRIKARQVAQLDTEYGEGGLEFLEGGSHASGNDINLHTRNKEGRNMRAEGGEAMAIINKRNTRKYKGILPDVIDSLNKGIFEDKYLNAFENGAQLHARIISQPVYTGPNLSSLENKLDRLVQQGNNRIIVMPDGSFIEQIGNVKRITKRS